MVQENIWRKSGVQQEQREIASNVERVHGAEYQPEDKNSSLVPELTIN